MTKIIYTYTPTSTAVKKDNRKYITKKEFKIQQALGSMPAHFKFRYCPICQRETPAEYAYEQTSYTYINENIPTQSHAYICAVCSTHYTHHIYE